MGELYIYKDICTASLIFGYFSKDWKKTHFIVVLKPGRTPERGESSRPIISLEILGRILMDELQTQGEEEVVLNPGRCGFRKKKGITAALALIHESIFKGLSDQEKMVTLALSCNGKYGGLLS